MKTIRPLIILLSIALALWACRKDNDFELKPDDSFSISIRTHRLNVDFPHDNRMFLALYFREKYQPSPLPVFTGVDVVDSKGNYYQFEPCD